MRPGHPPGRESIGRLWLQVKHTNHPKGVTKVIERGWFFLLVVATLLGICACSSSSDPGQQEISVVLSADSSGGTAPFDVTFTLDVVGDIEGKSTYVPSYHFDSGQGRVSDVIEYSIPDTSTAVLRSYTWVQGYSGTPGVRKAVAYLKVLDGNVYSDTLRIVLE